MKACFNCEYPHFSLCATCSGLNNRADIITKVSNAHAMQLQGQMLTEAGHGTEKVAESMIAHAAKLNALTDASTPANPVGRLVERPGTLCDADGSDWTIIGDSQLESAAASAE